MGGRSSRVFTTLLSAAATLAIAAAPPREAQAFCGFYVGGADKKLFNNATVVVLMRDGTRTVLSMQNNYQGPPESFAMVVPVPIVLQKENVKTLPREVFQHVDSLAAPRLVEYWEQDPCPSPRRFHSASDTFTLPVRLGLLNSAGTQDLIVHILSRGKRYEVSNYPNVT